MIQEILKNNNFNKHFLLEILLMMAYLQTSTNYPLFWHAMDMVEIKIGQK